MIICIQSPLIWVKMKAKRIGSNILDIFFGKCNLKIFYFYLSSLNFKSKLLETNTFFVVAFSSQLFVEVKMLWTGSLKLEPVFKKIKRQSCPAITRFKETYSWQFVSCVVHNIFYGTTWLENVRDFFFYLITGFIAFVMFLTFLTQIFLQILKMFKHQLKSLHKN